jgi:hypothetical protein
MCWPWEPIHAVALALKAREGAGQVAEPDEVFQERGMGLADAAAVRALWRRQRALERVLKGRHESEPVKAEALRELEEVTEFLRTSPWLSRHGAERCVGAVTLAIKRFHDRLAGAVDAEGKPDPVLRAFDRHLYEHLLLLSGKCCGRAGSWAVAIPAGCFTYEPPRGLVWEVQSPKSKVQSLESEVQRLESEVQSPESKVQRLKSPRPATVSYLSRFLCAGFALALLVTGCTGPRPLKGGKAVTLRKAAGVIEQTVVQGENASQPTKQYQESIKVRTYTVPADSRVEQSQAPAAPAQLSTINSQPINLQPSTLNPQLPSSYILSAPMPVVEREETRARTELGAAQKDTARELGAKLSSLKGIVWVGVGLFVFGLASLVHPPLKLMVASVTTSAALMLGGVALMVLPTMVVGNELLMLGIVAVAVGGWFLAHRHGQLRGVVGQSLTSKV